jgi:hypothetical protein
MTTIETAKGTLIRPTAEDIDSVQVGTLVPNCFGEMKPAVEISFRGVDVKGRKFVGYYTATSATSRISGSIKEGEVVRDLRATRMYLSRELDAFDVPVRKSLPVGF